MNTMKKELLPTDREALLKELKERFEVNMDRHKGVEWPKVQAKSWKLIRQTVWSLSEMERTGGEPDVVAFDKKSGESTLHL